MAEKVVKVQIVPDPAITPFARRVYSNHAEISHTPNEFVIRFCDAPILTKKEIGRSQEIIKHPAPIVAEVVLPINLFPNLIAAMQENYNKYLKHYGRSRNEK
jgi:hypothetical protein